MMSIDINSEKVFPINAVRQHIPGRPSPSTLYRWFTRGARGARLETLVVGGKRFTSHEAVKRFIERTTENSPGACAPQPRS